MGIPAPQREELAGYLEQCRAAAPGVRWVEAASLHLTLRFLGGLPEGALVRLAAGLRGIPVVPFQIRLGATGTFGRAGAIRVVWLGVEGGRADLMMLAGLIEEQCGVAGLEPESRAFNPHLTLGRARERGGTALPELPASPAPSPWTAAGFGLYQSHLAPGGAVHSLLEEFEARAAGSR